MKNISLALFACLPLFLFAQNQDSLAVVREVDSLLRLNRKLTIEQDFDGALRLSDYAKNKAATVFGKNSLFYASCLHSEGRTLYQMGQYADAEPPLLEAMSIRERISGRENAQFAAILNGLGALYQEMGQYSKAEQFYKETILIRAKVLGKEDPYYTNSLNNLGSLYRLMERYAEAEPLLLEVRDIRARVLKKDDFENARILNDLGYLYLEMGDYVKAKPFFIEALDILERTVGTGDPNYALFLSDFADLYVKMGKYTAAKPILLQAKATLAETSGKNHPDYAVVSFKLAGLYLDMGEYAKSEEHYLEAMNIWREILDKNHPTYAAVSNNLALVYMKMGNYAKAEVLYLEAKDIWSTALGEDRPRYALSLVNLATLYRRTGEYAKAEKLYLEAKDVYVTSLGKNHPDYADLLNNLAILYSKIGLYSKSEPLFKEVISVRATVLGKEHPTYATSLNNLAMLHIRGKKYTEAEPLILEAIKIQEKIIGKQHPDYEITLNNLAVLYWETNRIAQATEAFLELNNLYRHFVKYAATYSSENQMLAYMQFYEDEIAQFHHFVQEHPNPALVQATYDNALFYNGFLLENYSRLFRLFAQADGPVRETLEQWQDYRRSLIREKAKPVAERKAAHITEWEGKAETLEKALMRDMAGYAEFTKQVTWQDVQKHLKPSTAAIEFISYRYHTGKPADSTMYAALVLLPDEAAPHFIPLFEERQLKPLFNLTHRDIYSSRSELRRLLWQPLEPLLRDVKTVYYAPSGLLHNINPAALLDETGMPISTNRQWVRVGSTRHLVANPLADQCFAQTPNDAPATSSNQPAQARHPGRQTAIIYGGIEYNMDSLAFKAANSIGTADSTGSFQSKDSNFRSIMEERNRGNRGGEEDLWEPLKSSDIEADEVNAILQRAGFRTEVQKGLAASEERIKKIGTSEPSPRVLHLATHGFAYPDPPKSTAKGLGETEPTYKLMEDPMMRSGLVLAGANHYWKNKRPLTNCEDGALVAYEVRDLNLQNTELVVLSACKSGLGDAVSSEGMYGLQRAFRIAGVKFLIVSLWDVPDVETRKLMGYFYQNWLEKKESLRDAFYHAQQTLRKKIGDDPFIWAGFVLVE